MAKTVKGARVRLRRSSFAGDKPTIPDNEDHTTGWKDTDIYIGELFINTSVSNPKIWFRESTGVTQMATLDKITNRLTSSQIPSISRDITNEFTTSITITDTIADNTQYVVINDSAVGPGLTSYHDVELDLLETDIVKVVHISLTIADNGNILGVKIKGSAGNIINDSVNGLKGISLMWDTNQWVILSNTTN